MERTQVVCVRQSRVSFLNPFFIESVFSSVLVLVREGQNCVCVCVRVCEWNPS